MPSVFLPLAVNDLFESLSDKLQSVFARLKGKGRLSEADVNEAMRRSYEHLRGLGLS